MASWAPRVSVLSTTWRYLLLGAVSGLVWGAVGGSLGASAARRAVWGGVLASPLIGLVVAIAFRRGAWVSRVSQIFLALLSLYCAAALFALGADVRILRAPVAAGVAEPLPPVASRGLMPCRLLRILT